MTARRKIVLAVLLLLFAAAKFVLLWWWQNRQPPVRQLSCRPALTACTFENGAYLRLTGIANARTPFAVQAGRLPENVQTVSVSFEMRGMDMGFNRFDLKKQPDGTWHAGNVRLPVCSAARHDWLVRWRVDGREYAAPFETLP